MNNVSDLCLSGGSLAHRGTDPVVFMGMPHLPESFANTKQHLLDHPGKAGLHDADMDCTLDWLRQETKTPAPKWQGKALAPGERLMRVAAKASDVLQGLQAIFTEVVPAEMCTEAPEAWRLSGLAFVDYIALGVEMRVHEDMSAPPTTVVVFQHTSHNDAPRFSSLVDSVGESLGSKGLSVISPKKGGRQSDLLDDDFEDEFLDPEEDDEEAWSTLLKPVLGAAGCGAALAREEAVQVLARWAEQRPGCRKALSSLMAGEYRNLLLRTLRAGAAAPLTELYPLVVALKFATYCQEGAMALTGSVFALLPHQDHLPHLVARELAQAKQQLKKVPGSPVKEKKVWVTDNPSNASTRYTAAAPLSCGWSEASASSAIGLNSNGRLEDSEELFSRMPANIADLCNLTSTLWSSESGSI
mmetsp:Transcript_45348/g.102697  ORF Transcript_45348/g.102697 Transcript_45348/m.102697 type:complete len:414 (+) Transcript_45348:112-1353(+)